MTKKILLILSLFLLLLAACSAPAGQENAAVSDEAILIDVYRVPT